MDYLEATPMPIQGNGSIIAVEHKAQIEALVDTAHKYPRSIKKFEDEAITMATVNQETASKMFYAVPRAGKMIEGPSARLAEIVAVAWRNLRYGAKVSDVGESHITCVGYCCDLEKNVAAEAEVKVRITDKTGKRYNDDMITNSGNSGCSKAMRNAIIRVVPRAYIDKVYNKAKEVAIGAAMTLSKQQETAFDYIKKMGIPEDRILARVNRPSIKDVTFDDIGTLRGLATAVKDGELSVDEAFPPVVDADTPEEKPKATAKGAAAKAKEKLGAAPAPEPEPAPTGWDGPIPARDSEELDVASSHWSTEQGSQFLAIRERYDAEGKSPQEAHELAWLEFHR